MKALIFLATFASVTLYLPNAGQTVLGAATTTARVGDTVRVGVFVDQADAGLTELFVAIPYNPSVLEYTGVEGTGLTAVVEKLVSESRADNEGLVEMRSLVATLRETVSGLQDTLRTGFANRLALLERRLDVLESAHHRNHGD